MRHAVVLAALLACPGCDVIGAHLDNKYVEREEKRFSITGRPEVALTTFDGAIEIRPWDKAEVEVVIEKRGPDKASVAEIEVEATQSGDRIQVEVKSPRHRMGLHLGASPVAKLLVSLPVSSDIVARSSDGAIDIERMSGRVELRSGDGSIRASGMAGDVNAQTGDGRIDLDGTFSGLHARSGDGRVKIRVAPGATPAGDWDVSTGDGSVTLELPEGFNGELDAHTGDGRVEIEGLTVSNVTGEIRKNSVRGRLGSGGHVVHVRTGDGSITVRAGS
jgi:DUF4097 and DUF4098 domain-containing protein YvlB